MKLSFEIKLCRSNTTVFDEVILGHSSEQQITPRDTVNVFLISNLVPQFLPSEIKRQNNVDVFV
jgi:hypothetical protein